MFGVGSQEILLIMVAVLLLFGGKRLPEIARTLGKSLGSFRSAVKDVQREFDLESLTNLPPSNSAPPEKRLPGRPAAKEPVQPDKPIKADVGEKVSTATTPPAVAKGSEADTRGGEEPKGSGDHEPSPPRDIPGNKS